GQSRSGEAAKMSMITLEQVVGCPTLPSLPAVALQVLKLAANPNVQLDEIAEIIQNDPALAARILKTVNSSFYGLSNPCPTIRRALSYLGLNAVKSLVLSFSLADWANAGQKPANPQDMWGCCILSAAVSRRLATLLNVADPEEAFLAALMQDI